MQAMSTEDKTVTPSSVRPLPPTPFSAMVRRPGPATAASHARPATGPADCASRDRASDAAAAVNDMATLLNAMDPDVVKRLVHAREAAAGVYKAFPEGDRRFDSVETDSEDEEGEEEVLHENGDGDGGRESCIGLFDGVVHPNAQASLSRAREDHGIDLVKEMDAAGLTFFEKIKIVNYIRRMCDEGGSTAEEAVPEVRRIIKTKDPRTLGDEKLLRPVIPGDLMLTALETEEDLHDSAMDKTEDVTQAVRESLRASHILPEVE